MKNEAVAEREEALFVECLLAPGTVLGTLSFHSISLVSVGTHINGNEYEALGPCPGPRHSHTCCFISPSQQLPVVRDTNSDSGRSNPQSQYLAEQQFPHGCLQNSHCQTSVLAGFPPVLLGQAPA